MTANLVRAMVLFALILVPAACADPPDPEGGSPGAGEVATPPEDTGRSDPPSAPAPTDSATWTTGIVGAPPTTPAPPLPVLTALRTGTHPEWVRVVFEVDGDDRPGYHLEYIDRPLRACGSGEQIFPVGDGWLEIRLEPAAAHTEEGEATLGPREVVLDGPQLLRIYRTCDFEGIVTHVLALASPNAYRVVTLQNPLRIVVDVER